MTAGLLRVIVRANGDWDDMTLLATLDAWCRTVKGIKGCSGSVRRIAAHDGTDSQPIYWTDHGRSCGSMGPHSTRVEGGTQHGCT